MLISIDIDQLSFRYNKKIKIDFQIEEIQTEDPQYSNEKNKALRAKIRSLKQTFFSH